MVGLPVESKRSVSASCARRELCLHALVCILLFSHIPVIPIGPWVLGFAPPKPLRELPLPQMHFRSRNAKLRAPRRALTSPLSGPGRISAVVMPPARPFRERKRSRIPNYGGQQFPRFVFGEAFEYGGARRGESRHIHSSYFVLHPSK